MRPQLIYFALTSTALIISGCSSTRSVSNPFRGTAGVASSSNNFNEYDRDPPAPRQSSRIAAEPSPVPPARGISLSRIIDATPAGFRRAIGCGDSCTGDACTTDVGNNACGTEGCAPAAKTVRPARRCLLGFHLLKRKRIGCFKKLRQMGCTDSPCTDTAACTDQGCNTCAAPEAYCPPQAAQTPDCYPESRPRIAPPLGESQPEYDDRPTAPQPPQRNDDVPDAPGMVPEIPVDPIGQTRPLQPEAWQAQPLYGTVDHTGQTRKPVIYLEPPVWRSYTRANADEANGQNQLFPSASPLRTLSRDSVSSGGSEIDIQPLMRIKDQATQSL